jgi:hypothetical protein
MGERDIVRKKGILALAPAGMKNRPDWRQADSDVLAHFIQVNQQICGPRWHARKNSFKVPGDQLLEAECPDLEQFVFAAVYFRQLFAMRDQAAQGTSSPAAIFRHIHECPTPLRLISKPPLWFCACLSWISGTAIVAMAEFAPYSYCWGGGRLTF